jgi:3-oxoacyl-[acyl-carrier protein] reductase
LDLRLTGLRAIITGGTKGIGRAIVETLIAEGCHVALCARSAYDIKRTTEQLANRGVKVLAQVLDVADPIALKRWVGDSAAGLGGIDIVIANVSALAVEPGEKSWHKSFETDMLGTVRLVEAALPHLERSKAASIVTLASVSAREIDFAAGSYGAMKAALIHYTQGLAQQWASKHIRANSVSPGNTYFAGGVWENIEHGNPALFKQALAMNPSGRMAKPEEIARSVVFLASPASSYTSGTNLVVDGALTRGVQL